MLTFSSQKFLWNNADRKATSEISELGIGNWPSQFYIKSSRTGEVRLFLFQEDIINGKGEDAELSGRIYFCPGGELSVIIFND